jgi:hypothetical protein
MDDKEERWPLERVIEETKNSIRELSLYGAFPEEDDPDLSYITQDLIDSYWNDAKDKDEELAKSELTTSRNVACYWGNRWAHISTTRWAYTNNHSGTGCDPVTEGTLCGSGHRWRVSVRALSGRYCRNGAPNPKMAWP